MASIGQIVNIESYRQSAAVNGGGNMTGIAAGSQPGETNEWHVAALVVGVGLLVVVAGLINVQLGASIGKSKG